MRLLTRTQRAMLIVVLAVVLVAGCASTGGGQSVPISVEGQPWISEFIAGVLNCVTLPIVVLFQLFGRADYAVVDPNLVGRPAYVIGYLTLGVFFLVMWLRALSRRFKR